MKYSVSPKSFKYSAESLQQVSNEVNSKNLKVSPAGYLEKGGQGFFSFPLIPSENSCKAHCWTFEKLCGVNTICASKLSCLKLHKTINRELFPMS